MKKILFSTLVLIFIVSFPMLVAAQDLLKQADALFDKKGIENYKQSLDLYLKAAKASPKSFEANWKYARACRYYGNESMMAKVDGWKEICAKYGKEGMNYALKAIELAPNKPAGHYYYGLNVGTYSDGVSIVTAIAEGLKNKTQNSFEKVYKLDKMYDKAGVLLSLGRFWTVLPWPMNSKEKAYKYYQEYKNSSYFDSREEGPLYLSELYLDYKKDEHKNEAKAMLEKLAKSSKKFYADQAKKLLKENF